MSNTAKIADRQPASAAPGPFSTVATALAFTLACATMCATMIAAGCSTKGSASKPGDQPDGAGGDDVGAAPGRDSASTGAVDGGDDIAPAAGPDSGSAGAADGGGDTRVDAGVGGPPPPLTANVKVHVAGDSTAAIFPPTDPTARVGWAAVWQQFFGAGVQVNDAARSGRSSKSFIDEGFWTSLRGQIQPGDYVFIQFAHNDEKIEDPARYTDPATTFREYLETYIRDTRAAGGFAVLLTPISRRQFAGTTIVATHGAYPAAVAAVGLKTGTPVIDMTEKTRVLFESLGPTASIPLFAVGDETHLSALGAPEVARLVVEGIRELALPLAERLAP